MCVCVCMSVYVCVYLCVCVRACMCVYVGDLYGGASETHIELNRGRGVRMKMLIYRQSERSSACMCSVSVALTTLRRGMESSYHSSTSQLHDGLF